MSADKLEISVQEYQALSAAGASDLVLLDCREPDEWALSRLAGAVCISMREIPARLAELDPARELIVMCHHGRRSYRVTLFLAQQGYRARSLAGGIDAWSREIDPTVPRY